MPDGEENIFGRSFDLMDHWGQPRHGVGVLTG